ncbi:MAG TPA: DUF6326 family protein [Candidatus Saccharimonadaceae bacterium]|nr:DUF6326 family protein [Candidatus Saccharimonadaceae bacterium]
MKAKRDEQKVNVRLKIAAAWASFSFLYVYVDLFGLYMPGKIDDILIGRVFEFDITQGFLLTSLVLVSIPILMIFFSTILPAKLSRWANIIVATLFIPFTLFNLVGGFWTFMAYGAVVEVILLCLIIGYAWKWPKSVRQS